MADVRTYGNMIDRIMDELKRDDLGTSALPLGVNVASIANSIQDAVLEYQREALFINDAVDNGVTVAHTVVGQNMYPLPPDLWALTKLDINANNVIQELYMKSIQYIDSLDSNALVPTLGTPIYAALYQNQLRLYPTPDTTTYSLKFIYQAVIAAPVNPGDTNFWTTSAEATIRNRAKYKLNIEVIRDKEAALLDKEAELSAWAKLIRETQEKLFTRTLRATKF